MLSTYEQIGQSVAKLRLFQKMQSLFLEKFIKSMRFLTLGRLYNQI